MNYYEEIKDQLNSEMWFNNKKYAIEKKDRLVVKLYDKEDEFIRSIIVPTVMFPLNAPCDYKIFSYKNTIQTEDEKILSVFDKVKYQIGRCYQNSDNLASELAKIGIKAKCYVGWLFLSRYDFPIHHCWCVVESNEGDILLDLADEGLRFVYASKTYLQSGENIDENRERLVEFYKEGSNMSNSERCFPVGQCTPHYLYIGSECSGEEGRRIYKELVKEFPNHCCDSNTDINGYNPTQRMMQERGIMD